VEQASACLVLNFINVAKFKCKQAEACSTGGNFSFFCKLSHKAIHLGQEDDDATGAVGENTRALLGIAFGFIRCRL
jgi:hypothetical protein